MLSKKMIANVKEINSVQKEEKGNWSGYRPFVVQRKVPECELVTSIYLRPQDGGDLPEYLPGQYIAVQANHPTQATLACNFSLSDKPGEDVLRISVMQAANDNGSADGLMSTFLCEQVKEGDQLLVGPPCGEFVIDPNTVDDRPVVFLAGGIGVTPLLSMAKTLVNYGVLAPIYFFHAVKNSSSHPFIDEVQMMVSDKDFVETQFFYDEPNQADIDGGGCPRIGRIDTALLRDETPFQTADFYCCGPKPFMQSVLGSLKELGVDDSRIHFEFFGPQQQNLEA